jgi:hypothetical protein
MVLLDSQPPTAFTGLPGYPGFYSSFRKASALFPSLARFGVLRLASTQGEQEMLVSEADSPPLIRCGPGLRPLSARSSR